MVHWQPVLVLAALIRGQSCSYTFMHERFPVSLITLHQLLLAQHSATSYSSFSACQCEMCLVGGAMLKMYSGMTAVALIVVGTPFSSYYTLSVECSEECFLELLLQKRCFSLAATSTYRGVCTYPMF